MNRLQKKCVIGASAMHGLLVAIVIFAPGFSHQEDKSVPLIEFVQTTRLTDSVSQGGTAGAALPQGNAKSKETETIKKTEVPLPSKEEPAPPKIEKTVIPEPVKPKPEPAPVRQPDPPKHQEPKPEEDPFKVKQVKAVKPVKPVETKPQPAAPAREIVKKPVDTTTKKITLGTVVQKDSKALKEAREAKDRADRKAAEEAAAAAAAAETRQRVGRGVENGVKGLLSRLNQDLSKGTSVEVPGAGASGPASANYKEMVFSRYQIEFENAVLENGKSLDNDNTVEVLVTVERSGRVSSKIIRASGSQPLDRLVQNILKKVTSLPRFPDSFPENERQYRITFDLKTIQRLG